MACLVERTCCGGQTAQSDILPFAKAHAFKHFQINTDFTARGRSACGSWAMRYPLNLLAESGKVLLINLLQSHDDHK